MNGSCVGGKSELAQLLTDMQTSDPAKMHFEQFAEKARRLKGEGGAIIMSQYWEDVYNDAHREGLEAGLEEGRAEGLAEGLAVGRVEGRVDALIESARAMMLKLGISAHEAVETLELSGDEQRRVLETLAK